MGCLRFFQLLSQPLPKARKSLADRQTCAPVLEAPDAAGADGGEVKQNCGVNNVLVNKERMRVRIREVEYREVIEHHEYGPENGRQAHS